MGMNRLLLQKIILPFLFSISILILFQNCQSGVESGGSSNSSSTSNDVLTVIPPVVPNPCPPDVQGSPEMSDLYISGTSTVGTLMTTKSGYTTDSGNTASDPKFELSLLNTNVTPVDVCDQSASVQCNISIDAGSTGVLWGTSDRVPITGNDFQCVASSPDLDIDVPGKIATTRPNTTTIQIQPKNQTPDITSGTHVCMQGSATVTVKLRNPYNKDSASRTFKLNITNSCPKEQKVNAELEAEAQGLLGEAVSVSGTRAAVLTTGLNAYSLVNVGGVRIYEYNGSSWIYTTTVIPPTAELENDVKPTNILLSGNNLFVGNASINSQTGRVWFFQRETSTGAWNKILTINGTASSKLGTSFAFDGSHLFVGAPSVSGVGFVKIYTLSGSTLTETSTINGVDATSDFGASLAVSGTKLIIGAPGSAINLTSTGTFFTCNISTITSPTCTPWVLTGGNKIGTDVVPATSRFGSGVALKNNMLLVAAKNWYPSTMTTAPAIRNGLVALIDLNIGATAVKIFKGANEELYGASVAFGTSSFFIGAKESLGKRGRVVQMALPTDGSVNATLRFNYYGLNQGPLDRFGSSIAFSESGATLLVGAPSDQELGFSTAGSASFFNVIAP